MSSEEKHILPTMSEEEIFQIMVEIYREDKRKDNSRLNPVYHKKRSYSKLKPVYQVSDQYYWSYLVTDKEWFKCTMEIEMFRRKLIPKLNLICSSSYRIRLRNKPNNILDSRFYKRRYGKFESNNDNPDHIHIINNIRFYPECIGPKTNFVKSLEMDNIYCSMLSTPNNGYRNGLKLYPTKFISLLEDISKMGGIIAGGFVSGLINQVYYLVPVREQDINFNYDPDDNNSPFQGNNTIIAYDEVPIFDGPNKSNRTVIPGFGMLAMVFMSRHLKEDDKEIYHDRNDVYKCRKRYRDYNLEKGLEDLQDYVYVRNNKLYRKYFKKSPDVDIFVKDLKVAEQLVDYLSEKCQNILGSKIICSEFATTFRFGRFWPKIQIIKRVYNSVDEVLGGFDLDPSRAALLWEMNRLVAVCTKSYIKSVIFGVNLIVPSRQSESFNYRIIKYCAKGFEPYFTMLDINDIYSKGKNIVHSAKNLLKHFTTEGHQWAIKKASDYDKKAIKAMDDPPKGIPRDKRLKLIKRGELEATASDVFQFANKLLHKIYVTNSQIVKNSKLEYFIVKVLSSVSWKTIDPGSQITGSFNPTKIDYLAGKEKEEKDEKPKLNSDVLVHLPNVLANIIDDYTGDNYNFIITYLFLIEYSIGHDNFDRDYGLFLLDKYNSGQDA